MKKILFAFTMLLAIAACTKADYSKTGNWMVAETRAFGVPRIFYEISLLKTS